MKGYFYRQNTEEYNIEAEIKIKLERGLKRVNTLYTIEWSRSCLKDESGVLLHAVLSTDQKKRRKTKYQSGWLKCKIPVLWILAQPWTSSTWKLPKGMKFIRVWGIYGPFFVLRKCLEMPLQEQVQWEHVPQVLCCGWDSSTAWVMLHLYDSCYWEI